MFIIFGRAEQWSSKTFTIHRQVISSAKIRKIACQKQKCSNFRWKHPVNQKNFVCRYLMSQLEVTSGTVECMCNEAASQGAMHQSSEGWCRTAAVEMVRWWHPTMSSHCAPSTSVALHWPPLNFNQQIWCGVLGSGSCFIYAFRRIEMFLQLDISQLFDIVLLFSLARPHSCSVSPSFWPRNHPEATWHVYISSVNDRFFWGTLIEFQLGFYWILWVLATLSIGKCNEGQR